MTKGEKRRRRRKKRKEVERRQRRSGEKEGDDSVHWIKIIDGEQCDLRFHVLANEKFLLLFKHKIMFFFL